MQLLRRPLPRFFVWAILLVGIAVATGVAGLAWWLIALIELAAWTVVTVVERTLWHRSVAAPAGGDDEIAAPPPLLAAAAPPEESEPELEPVAAGVAANPEPGRRRMIRPPVRAKPSAGQLPSELVRWNVWSLERLARDHPSGEELEFLVVSLREFADSDGQLPADFDPLVRESFGELLLG